MVPLLSGLGCQLSNQYDRGHGMAIEDPEPLRKIGWLRTVTEVGDGKVSVRYPLGRTKYSVTGCPHRDELYVYVRRFLRFLYAQELHRNPTLCCFQCDHRPAVNYFSIV